MPEVVVTSGRDARPYGTHRGRIESEWDGFPVPNRKGRYPIG